MKLDLKGRSFIFKEEGVKLKAYLCAAGVPTIGVGCTYYPDGRKVKLGDTITLQECNELFDDVVENFEAIVNREIKVPISQNQFNALVSFAFNIGIEGFRKSTLLKMINAKAGKDAISEQFARWNKAGGKVNAGLVGRRKRETLLYFS